MKSELISNRGTTNFDAILSEEFKKCKTFDIASAFITEHALTLLGKFAKNKYKNRQGRILISLYQSFNSKSILTELARISSSNKNIQVRISRNERFHWKFYQFKYVSKKTVYIGSANFTKEGLTSPGEIISKINVSRADKSRFDLYDAAFNKEWGESVAINKIPLEKYKQAPPLHNSSRLHPDIKKILSAKTEHRKSDAIKLKRITITRGKVSSLTEKKIKQSETEWKNYEYFSCVTKSEYDTLRKYNTFLLIEIHNRDYTLSIVQKIDEISEISTPDGKYFIAYKYLRRRRETPSIRDEFESMGINYHSRRFVSKSIGVHQEKRIFELLGM